MKNSIDRTLKLLFDVKEDREITIRPYSYVIGRPEKSFQLFFDDEPSGNLYYNSFFIKIFSYKSTNEATDCINFHFSNYSNKAEFLDFVQNEILDIYEVLDGGIRLSRDHNKKRILNAAIRWIEATRTNLSNERENEVRLNIETEIIDLITEAKNAKIEVNPQVDSKKLILIFLALQKLVLDEKGAGVLKLKHTVELPHLLKYFAPFADNKVDGIRKQTTLLASGKNLSENVPSYLTDALHRFFYKESIKVFDFE